MSSTSVTALLKEWSAGNPQAAEGLGVSPRTVARKWRMGKAYLDDWVAGQGKTDDA